MIKVLFVCYGNICRSTMAEFLFKDMLMKNHLNEKIYVESAGTSDEEEGHPVYSETRKILNSLNIDCSQKRARKVNYLDYDKFDLLIGMETSNTRDLLYFFGQDKAHKIKRLLDFTSNPRNIADPWYTRDFQLTYCEIKEGLDALLSHLKDKYEL